MKKGFLNAKPPKKAASAEGLSAEVCGGLVSEIVERSTQNGDGNNGQALAESVGLKAAEIDNGVGAGSGGAVQDGDVGSIGCSTEPTGDLEGAGRGDAAEGDAGKEAPDAEPSPAWREDATECNAGKEAPDAEPSPEEDNVPQRDPSPEPPPPPPPPALPEIVHVTRTSVSVRCSIGASGAEAGVRFVVAEEGGDERAAAGVASDSMESIHEATLSGLRPGAKHAAWVVLTTQLHGDITGEKVQFTTVSSHPERPSPPTVSGKTKSSIKLRWLAPFSCGEPISTYQVELGEGPSPQHTFLAYEGVDSKCEIKNLRPGTVHSIFVRAVNGIGRGPLSDALMVETHATTPATPELPYVLHMALHSITVGWYPPFETGGSEVTGFTLECDDGMGEGFMIKFNGLETTYTLLGAQPAQLYRFRVRAQNSVGLSQYSPVLEVVGSCGPPGPPGPVCVARQGAYALNVCWDAPSALNGSPVTMYQVGMRLLSDGVVPLTNFVIVFVGAETSCEVPGLQPACLYEFVTVAVSPLGPSPPSQPSLLETSSAPPGSADPPFLIQGARNALHVGWHPPVITNGAPITAFRLEQLSNDQANALVLFEGPTVDFVLQGLEPGCPVWLRISAANVHGYGPPSAVACFNTACAAPGPPTGLEAVPKGRSAAHVTWSPPYKNGGSHVTGYRVHYVRVCQGEEVKDSKVIDVEEPCASIGGLSPGSAYAVCVQACNAEGFGEVCPHVSFFTEAAPPGVTDAPVLEEAGWGGLRITWGPPSKDNGAPIEEYVLQMNDGPQFVDLYKGCLSSFEVGSLQPGAAYRFRVRAANRIGQGPYSPTVQYTTRAVEPGPPLAVTLLGVTHNSVKLKWSPPAFTGGSAPHSYAVLLRRTDADAVLEDAKEVWSGATTSAKIKTSPDATYDVFVVAYNSVGPGTETAPLRVATPAAPSKGSPVARAPAVLASPSVSVRGPHNAVVSWAGGGGNKKFCLQMQIGEDGEEKIVYSGGSTSHEIKNLKAGEQYSVRVAAENDAGRGPWSQPTPLTTRAAAADKNAGKRPAAPEGLSLDRAGKSSLKLRWSEGRANESSGISYRVEIAEPDAEFSCVYTGAALECKATKLSPSSRYRVRVQALNKWGSSAFCEEQVFKTSGEPASRTWSLAAIFIGLFLAALYCFLFQEPPAGISASVHSSYERDAGGSQGRARGGGRGAGRARKNPI